MFSGLSLFYIDAHTWLSFTINSNYIPVGLAQSPSFVILPKYYVIYKANYFIIPAIIIMVS